MTAGGPGGATVGAGVPGASPAPPAAAAHPRPWQLEALGTVLCLYRARGAELEGWRRAVRAEACSAVQEDGLDESLRFFDRDGRCCWRLFLLPDSDFLAWDALARTLPAGASASGGVGERLWRRLADRLSGGWRCSVLRLSPSPHGSPGGALGASLATLSALGAEVAQRIARAEGVDAAARIDDCCCERAARAGRGVPGIHGPAPSAARAHSPHSDERRHPA